MQQLSAEFVTPSRLCSLGDGAVMLSVDCEVLCMLHMVHVCVGCDNDGG